MTREELEEAYKQLRVKLVEKQRELDTVRGKYLDTVHGVGRKKPTVFRKIPMDMTIGMLNEMIVMYSQEHPDMSVFYDGDMKAVVGIKTR